MQITEFYEFTIENDVLFGSYGYFILLLPIKNNGLFGDYMQVMQMAVFWVFPHEKNDLFGNYGCLMEKSALYCFPLFIW